MCDTEVDLLLMGGDYRSGKKYFNSYFMMICQYLESKFSLLCISPDFLIASLIFIVYCLH